MIRQQETNKRAARTIAELETEKAKLQKRPRWPEVGAALVAGAGLTLLADGAISKRPVKAIAGAGVVLAGVVIAITF